MAGHLLYYSLEILRGRPLPERFVETEPTRQGFGLFDLDNALMAVAVFNDLFCAVKFLTSVRAARNILLQSVR